MKKIILLSALYPAIVSAFCFEEAGQRYNVDPLLLKAIAMQESFLNPNAININKNKKGEIVSRDYGLMQINSTWFDDLSDFNVNESTVMAPCFNVNLGAWVLSSNFSTHGFNWNSVGAYNAGFKKSKQIYRDDYISKIKKHYQELQQEYNLSPHRRVPLIRRYSDIHAP
ncbi:lytic transglycosylase [Vibrio sp. MACH09]|uniref:lytic transglycosylase domain-containing protein n=1 Tax=Vibrio sp. MACH09 TaxID=3025122 RepID=UPI00278EC678|nr:lytic transglycosylase domain-containing protein [Vibrio sp. MACH09]GLO64171.1 lytic transglycosylase [Vibrio sp. MACH09]